MLQHRTVDELEAWERAKAEGARAEDLMSAPPVCARPEWNVVETARLMTRPAARSRPSNACADPWTASPRSTSA